jgi:predicted permease
MYLRRRRMVSNAALLLRRLLRLFQHRNAREKDDVEKGGDFENRDTVSSNGIAGKDEGLDHNTITGTTITPTPTVGLKNNGSEVELPQQPTDHHSSHRHHHDILSRSWHFLKQLLKPCTVVIILSFVISLVDPIKALFIPPSSNFQPHFRPTAPDGQPPLAFIFDTATFIGDACIPLGLICLGSALACLSLRSGGPFPKGAIASLALGKMVVIPIIGVAITRWFARVGFVHHDDKVLQFICMCVVSLLIYHSF